MVISLDVLLCHDDELDTRRFAFVLYLVQPWTIEDGGRLDLFNMDGTRSHVFCVVIYERYLVSAFLFWF